MATFEPFRVKEGLGRWEHRGKAAFVGVGHSPTDRRWDEKLENSLGAYAILAAKRALDDAGLTIADIDGVVSAPGPLGERWGPTRAYFEPPYDSEDGLSMVTAEWLIKQMGIKDPKFVDSHPIPDVLSTAAIIGIEAVAQGLCNTCLIIRPTGNLAGRYGQAGATAQPEARGGNQYQMPWGMFLVAQDALTFQRYLYKYNQTHDKLAAFAVHNRNMGLMSPHGYYYQHRPEPLTTEDYISGRWISKPNNLYDCDLPVQACGAYIVTRADRAKDLKNPPAYALAHATNRFPPKSVIDTLEEMELAAAAMKRKLAEGSGHGIEDVDVLNVYDGFITFSAYWLEGFGYAGVKHGEALDFYQTDMGPQGPHHFNTSGGNNGNGRMHGCAHLTDSIQQVMGKAGGRQVKDVNITIAGNTRPVACGYMMLGKYPE